jgi:hypothetical protein
LVHAIILVDHFYRYGAISGVGVTSQVLAGWLRYIAVVEQNFTLVIISSILLGFGGSVIISTYTSCPEKWFPPKERTLATSIAVRNLLS